MKLKLIPTALAISLVFVSALLLAAKGRNTVDTALSAQEVADMRFIREEEKLARDTYLTSYENWSNNIFSNIAASEQSHMDAVLALLKKYRVPNPAAGN